MKKVNKELEALSRIFEGMSNNVGYIKYFELIRHALNELEELKKRDTPMKWIDVVDETGHYDKCPVCGYPSYNDLGHNHFCTVCGQRLEYEEKNEMNDVIDIVKALNELDFICIDVDKKDTYIFKMLNDLVPFLEKISQLEKDVRRYFDLGHIEEPSTEQFEEYLKLTEKLLKVGKEE